MSLTRIRLNGVDKVFSSASAGSAPTPALSGVSLDVADGEFVCLLGPSGCGKSTILNLIAGFELPDRGEVRVDGRPIAGPGPERGFVFQQPTLFPWLSVRDNVTFGPRMAGMPAAQRREAGDLFLRHVGLQEFGDHFPWQLSGGMRQRVALARAWIGNPEILLMDEPFGALDAQTRLAMQEWLNALWLRTHTTILFVTHDVDEALLLADRIVVMSARPGRILEELTVPFGRPRDPEQMLSDPKYGVIKRDILHVVREEASRAIVSVREMA